jgi:hypothetical protein
LSSFADHPQDAAEYLLPVFLDAAQHIPRQKQASTKVFVKGTAGMRLLPVDAQTKLWDALYTGLDDNPQLPFILQRENFGTIDGYYEAYYAVLASNFVAGSIDGNLRRIPGTEMVGALDMGGSSTQLIFHTGTRAGEPVRDSDFWSHSWLNFGVDKVREKVWRHLLKRHVAKAGKSSKSGEVTVVDNPCGFVGHEEKIDDQYVLRGTGKGVECVEAIKAVLWPAGQCDGTPCFIDDVAHPPLQGEFYAMSVYFYAIDCIRQHGTMKLAAWCVRSHLCLPPTPMSCPSTPRSLPINVVVSQAEPHDRRGGGGGPRILRVGLAARRAAHARGREKTPVHARRAAVAPLLGGAVHGDVAGARLRFPRLAP